MHLSGNVLKGRLHTSLPSTFLSSWLRWGCGGAFPAGLAVPHTMALALATFSTCLLRTGNVLPGLVLVQTWSPADGTILGGGGKLGVERRKWVIRRGGNFEAYFVPAPFRFLSFCFLATGRWAASATSSTRRFCLTAAPKQQVQLCPKAMNQNKIFPSFKIVLLGYRHRDRKGDQHIISTFLSQRRPHPSRSRAHYKNCQTFGNKSSWNVSCSSAMFAWGEKQLSPSHSKKHLLTT